MVPMRVAFYFDPVCPWCWVTARWLMGVRERRSLEIDWRSFSLAIKNEGDDSQNRWAAVQQEGRRALRVAEAVRAQVGPEPIERLYVELSRRRHHDGDQAFELRSVLTAADLDPELAAAADDASWDDPIEASMAGALALAGEDVGVPIIVLDDRGFYGPILSEVPPPDAGDELFEQLERITRLSSFFELKRGRMGRRPLVGDRP